METGLVVMPGNVQALKNGIGRLLNDKRLRKKLGESSKRFVIKNCTQKMAAEKHMKLFESLKAGV